jgi:hypothetical protein
MTKQTIAVRRASLPKCHDFRWEFVQTDGQLTLSHANDIKAVIADIFY